MPFLEYYPHGSLGVWAYRRLLQVWYFVGVVLRKTSWCSESAVTIIREHIWGLNIEQLSEIQDAEAPPLSLSLSRYLFLFLSLSDFLSLLLSMSLSVSLLFTLSCARSLFLFLSIALFLFLSPSLSLIISPLLSLCLYPYHDVSLLFFLSPQPPKNIYVQQEHLCTVYGIGRLGLKI